MNIMNIPNNFMITNGNTFHSPTVRLSRDQNPALKNPLATASISPAARWC